MHLRHDIACSRAAARTSKNAKACSKSALFCWRAAACLRSSHADARSALVLLFNSLDLPLDEVALAEDGVEDDDDDELLIAKGVRPQRP